MEFAKRGWPVLPLHFPTGPNRCSCSNPNCSKVGKHPATEHGLLDASRDMALITQWWRAKPKSNVGILTGKLSGLIVLDVDPRHGGEASLAQLELQYGKLPKTLKVRTGSDGWHYYFRHPGKPTPNRIGFCDGLDIRGDGGYIVAPSSIHGSQRPYCWEEAQAEVADMPSWLESIIRKETAAKKGKENLVPISAIQDGSRNDSLCSMGGFLKNKGLDQKSLTSALLALNQSLCIPPLDPEEVYTIAASLNRYTEETWIDLKELPEAVLAPEMQEDMLPSPLRAWCIDIAQRMQVPLEFTAGPAIVMIASLLGRKVVIRPRQHDDWTVIPNLWGILIAPPGSLKSPAISGVLKPINRLSVKAREDYIEELKKQSAEEIIAKTEIEALKDALKFAIKQGKPQLVEEKKQQLTLALKTFEEKHTVTERRYMTNDPTIEKMLTILEQNPQGILLYRDEISGWLETMYKSGREGDREFFLESWNGDNPYSMDRISRGSTFVQGLCLSALGGLQPSKFSSYVEAVSKGGKSDDGLLQRFQILLFPERRKKWNLIDRKPDVEAIEKMEDIVTKIDQIPLPKQEGNKVKRVEIHFSETAQLLANRWHQDLEERLIAGGFSPILECHLAKYRGLMPKLALIFSMVETLAKEGTRPEFVEEDAVQLSIRWCAFLEKHACKAYGEYLEPELVSGRKLLEKIKAGTVKDYDRCRDLYRRGWKGLTTAEEFDSAVKVLTEYGWIRTEVINPPTGRSSEVIRLHPSLRMAS